MARRVTGGWEFGTVANATFETGTAQGTYTAQATVKRSGGFAAKFDTTVSNTISATSFSSDISGLTFTGTGPISYWYRAYLCFADLPAVSAFVMAINPNADISVRLTSGGKLQLWRDQATSHQVGSDSAATIVADAATFYRVEIGFTLDASKAFTSVELRLDGVTVALSTTDWAAITSFATVTFGLGWGNSSFLPGASKVMYADDVAINDSSGASQNTWPGEGQIVLLKPTADSAVGASWTTSGGAATGLWDNVNNTPPTGIADTTANAGHQIRNAGANSTYDATLQSYAAAGVGALDTITLLIPMVNVASIVSTGGKSGSYGIVSNPTIAQRAFTGGSGTATFFWGGTAAGTWPTGWRWEIGTVTSLPAGITPATAPVARLTITGGTTSRVALADAMMMFVEYVAAAPAALPARSPQVVGQAVMSAATR